MQIVRFAHRAAPQFPEHQIIECLRPLLTTSADLRIFQGEYHL